MKAKDLKCRKCGGKPELHGSDYTDSEGPWVVCCSECGEESDLWALSREAWKSWKLKNAR